MGEDIAVSTAAVGSAEEAAVRSHWRALQHVSTVSSSVAWELKPFVTDKAIWNSEVMGASVLQQRQRACQGNDLVWLLACCASVLCRAQAGCASV
jgi:hypothetical protein